MLINDNLVISEDFIQEFNNGKEVTSTSDVMEFIENVKKANRIPIEGTNIYYADDSWNFNGYVSGNTSKGSRTISFKKFPDGYKEMAKYDVLISAIENRIKIVTLSGNIRQLRKAFLYFDSIGCTDVSMLTPKEIATYMNLTKETGNLNSVSMVHSALVHFFDFYNANIEEFFTQDYYDALEVIDPKVLSANTMLHKTSDIPYSLFNNIVSASIDVLHDKAAHPFYRGMAGMTLIESQTGLRTGELFALEIDCVQTTSIFDGEKAYYLLYKTTKCTAGNTSVLTEKTYVNEITKEAVDVLIELFRDKREEYDLPYLFLGALGDISPEAFPISASETSKMFNKYYAYLDKYFPTLFDEPTTDKAMPRVKNSAPGKPYVLMIRPTQYRVHMCTELHRKGIPQEYVEKFMSHLSSLMAYYYARPKKSPQEDMKLAMDTLKQIVTGSAVPIGAEKGLVEKIHEFVERNHYNVEKDLDAICKELANRIPIRVKTGGVCIKSSKFRECSNDAVTNEFYCAYGVCPNIYTFYYMADISYRQFCELRESIVINTEHGHIRQAQKDKNMLMTIIRNKLKPQMAEIKKAVEKHGITAVYEKYPNLSEIIERFDKIINEISEVEEAYD